MIGSWNRFMLLILLMGGVAVVSGSPRKGNGRAVANTPPITQAQIAQQKAFGEKTAPIRIDEFTDFECPACRALYMETLRPLIDNFVSNGKVYLVHHDFPLSMHPYSHKAAYYADAAAAIGQFELVEQALFTNQSQWAANGGKITPFLAAVLSPAQLKRVEELARTKAIHEAVQNDLELGQRLHVMRTPTMYVTYKGKRTPLVGVISYPILRRYLDALLKQ